MGAGQDVNVPLYLRSVVRNFQISRIGGESMNWETGNWGSMPSLVVESFLEISTGISRGMEYTRKRNASKSEARSGKGYGGRRSHNRGDR